MERPLESWLQAQSQWGLPPPPSGGFGASSLFAPTTPGLGLSAGIPPMMPAMPAEEEAPVEETGFTAAPFQPPRMMERPRNEDIFGEWLARLGIARPQAAPIGGVGQMMAQPQPQAAPRMLQAQPNEMPRGPVAPVAKPTYRVSPMLARRYPGATRMAQLVDGARKKRGY